MSESKHTPGPWEMWVGTDGSFMVSSSAEAADCLVICSRNPINHRAEESQANCYLIAAAPDLLAALQTTLEYFTDPDGGNPEFTEQRVRAAIAKATAPVKTAE